MKTTTSRVSMTKDGFRVWLHQDGSLSTSSDMWSNLAIAAAIFDRASSLTLRELVQIAWSGRFPLDHAADRS
jgi:hypothetical protein